MGSNETAWAGLNVGDLLRTPFGITEIRDLGLPEAVIVTDLGTWEFGEVTFTDPPGDGAPVDRVADYLSGPRYAVTSTTDYQVTPCTCGCRDCSRARTVHKLTARTHLIIHEPRLGCTCRLRDCHCCKDSSL